eukprot:7362824-Prymnesium_polylepis.1
MTPCDGDSVDERARLTGEATARAVIGCFCGGGGERRTLSSCSRNAVSIPETDCRRRRSLRSAKEAVAGRWRVS